jgi:hypothetical protein
MCLTSVSEFRVFFFLLSWGGVRLGPLGTPATNWPIVPAPDDRWWWMLSSQWNENWQGKPRYLEKTCPSATLSTTKPILYVLGSNSDCGGGKPATELLSYGAAHSEYNRCRAMILSKEFCYRRTLLFIYLFKLQMAFYPAAMILQYDTTHK